MNIPRKAIAGLTLSAAALFALVMEEGYTDKAVIPTKGDRPTIGFGSTIHEDGTPVKLGDTTTPQRALLKVKAHIDKEEASFIRSLPGVELHPGEHDIYMKWVYQFGTGNWWKSSMRKRLLVSDYKGACDALQTGDLPKARELNFRLLALHRQLFCEANPIPVKWALHEMGLMQDGIRLPLTWLSPRCHEPLRQAMRQSGVLV